MAKKNDDTAGLYAVIATIGGGYLWFAHGITPPMVIGIIILLFILLVIAKWAIPHVLRFIFGGFKQGVKTDTRSTDFLGRKKRKIQYRDSGKEVNQVTTRTWTGAVKKKTFVKPGRGTRQECHSCGAMVDGSQGRYICACGKRWGRK